MKRSIDPTKWWETPLAALIFFTRLPFWRLRQPAESCYRHVVEYWPLAGWLTGGAMAATFYVADLYAGTLLAALLAVAVRIVITGALHEDGLADFLDGFGGGRDRAHTLAIMKDPHIGTFGVLGLVVYTGLLTATLYTIGQHGGRLTIALAIMAGDPFCKMVSAQIIQFLPYARTAETAKAKTVYARYGLKAGLRLAATGLLPVALWSWMTVEKGLLTVGAAETLLAVPCVVFYLLYLLMNRRLQGYTGDCCGASFLITELSFYLTIAFLLG